MIAADIEALVKGTRSPRDPRSTATRSEAVAAVRASDPGLILADIQLADGSSGIDAVKDILGDHDVPVIFITRLPRAAADPGSGRSRPS